MKTKTIIITLAVLVLVPVSGRAATLALTANGAGGYFANWPGNSAYSSQLEHSRNLRDWFQLELPAQEGNAVMSLQIPPYLLTNDYHFFCLARRAFVSASKSRPGQPLAFDVDRGHRDAPPSLLARARDYTVLLAPGRAVLALGSPANPGILAIRCVGADVLLSGADWRQLPGVVSRCATDDPEDRRRGSPSCGGVCYRNVYPGVDVVYYINQGLLEYDFVVAPGGDPSRIALTFDGAERVEIDARGDLLVYTRSGMLRQPKPTIYQEFAGVRQVLRGGYLLRGACELAFELGPYDASRPLVIDPVVEYATYLGGTGEESPARVAVDRAGNIYVTGTTSSPDFPGTPVIDRSLGNQMDAFVAKFSPEGSLIYSTLVGGTCNDEGNAIAVDDAGNAFITGRVDLCHWANLQPGVLVAKISPTGELLYLYTFGARLADSSSGLGIAVDAVGNAYVTGTTSAGDFPTTTNAFQRSACGGFLGDGFVAKVNPAGNGLVYCSYLCGTAHDSANAIAIDGEGNAFVAGRTASHDFPTLNAFQPAHRGGPTGGTGFVSKLNPDGSTLLYSTFLGGTFGDVVTGIAVDAQGNAYVTGETIGGDFPTTPGVVQSSAPSPLCFGAGICSDAFVTKFNPAGSLIYSTFLAGEGDDTGGGIAVDGVGSAYVAGSTASLYFPIRDAFQPKAAGVSEVFVTKLNADGSRILFSSYLGGGRPTNSVSQTEGYERGSGIALGSDGRVYFAGRTVSTNFPTTAGAFQTNAAGGYCLLTIEPCGNAFVARINAGGPGIVPTPRLEVTPTELRAGGTITATWAGIDPPSPDDRLILFPLGDRADSFIFLPTYETTGNAAGALLLVLPATLAPGSYELRLMTPNPVEPSLLATVARSEPLTLLRPITLVPTVESGSILRVRVNGLRPGTYKVEASETLQPLNWRVVATNTVETGPLAEFTESVNSSLPRRFYRVVQ